ncbi:hypothetical protein [Brunnivagina elsteri]|uniref:Uncharacterized protein n=1 Tax=Brunnivagina elsteri CCALA 953 TaxID=987040 RepID=A0A2A2TDX2_9CYAN|nr:hypothetical protein [Calothrix elsteri]PAX51609.1 hypothetical protein CK510_23865 [Calothrix elsteri CCALA 953]
MKFLPYERLTIYSHLAPESAMQKLTDVVETSPNKKLRGSMIKPYRGEITGYKFKISRIINYKNSFLPVINGEIKSAMDGCCIHLKMQPHVMVICFMIVWSSPLISLLLMAVFATITPLIFPKLVTVSGSISIEIILVLLGFLLFAYSLVTIFFKMESTKSKAFFRELFN